MDAERIWSLRVDVDVDVGVGVGVDVDVAGARVSDERRLKLPTWRARTRARVVRERGDGRITKLKEGDDTKALALLRSAAHDMNGQV